MDYAQQLAFFANILEQKRLVTALEGNASIIDRETGLTYITPSGRMKLLLQREDISVMDESGAQIGGRGKRSSEYLLHEAGKSEMTMKVFLSRDFAAHDFEKLGYSIVRVDPWREMKDVLKPEAYDSWVWVTLRKSI